MKKKTHASKAIEAAASKAKYDTQIKNILKDAGILANILKDTVNEVKDCTIQEIIDSIEGQPEIETVSIEPGLTNRKITGSAEEDNIPGEGGIKFDIRFTILLLGEKRIRIIVNVEAQNDYYPGYDIVTRGVFYSARLISSQKDTEFLGDDYDSIKKVYSIWICMNVPKRMADTITEYHMTRHELYGSYKDTSRYDLMSVIIVGVGRQNETESHISAIQMLRVILSDMAVREKKRILEEKFNIPMSYELEEEMNKMCNLSDYVEQRGIEQGIERGIEILIGTCREFGSSKDETVGIVIDKYQLSMEDAQKKVCKYWK